MPDVRDGVASAAMSDRELRLRARIDVLTDRLEAAEAALANERRNMSLARREVTRWLNRAHKAEARLLDRGRVAA